MTDSEMLKLEYEIELVINKQLLGSKKITYDVYRKVADMIIKDIEHCELKIANQTP